MRHFRTALLVLVAVSFMVTVGCIYWLVWDGGMDIIEKVIGSCIVTIIISYAIYKGLDEPEKLEEE